MLRFASATFAATLVALLFVGPAAAQEIDPETGEVYLPPEEETPPPAEETPPPVNTTSEPNEQPAWYNGGPTREDAPPSARAADSETPDEGDADSDDDGLDDHERVIGRLAVGFMGASTVPIGSAGGVIDTVTAPALGVRYWATDLLGIDVGIGLGYLGGTASVGDTSIPADNAFAMTIHGGVPLAIFHEEHYKFLIIPELNFGFSTGTAFGGMMQDDRGRNGLLFQIGGRVGTEIHFGFMDVPQLSLQASVGLYFEYTNAGLGEDSNAPPSPSQSVTTYGLGTSVQGEPWDILLGALNALYYF